MDFDPQSLNEAIETASNAGGAVKQWGGAFSTFKALFDKCEASSNADLKAALAEMTLKVADAELASADLKMQLVSLKEEIERVNKFKSDLDRYELWQTPAGDPVYRLKALEGETEPVHFLCPNCIQDGRKRVLLGNDFLKECNDCKASYRFRPYPGTKGSARGSYSLA